MYYGLTVVLQKQSRAHAATFRSERSKGAGNETTTKWPETKWRLQPTYYSQRTNGDNFAWQQTLLALILKYFGAAYPRGCPSSYTKQYRSAQKRTYGIQLLKTRSMYFSLVFYFFEQVSIKISEKIQLMQGCLNGCTS